MYVRLFGGNSEKERKEGDQITIPDRERENERIVCDHGNGQEKEALWTLAASLYVQCKPIKM